MKMLGRPIQSRYFGTVVQMGVDILGADVMEVYRPGSRRYGPDTRCIPRV